eukprot:8214666-Ditylum_brightwellii.AAC.1
MMSKQSSLRTPSPNNNISPLSIPSVLGKSKEHSPSMSRSANRVAADVLVFFHFVLGIDKKVKFEIML